jgi:hypothetical protein
MDPNNMPLYIVIAFIGDISKDGKEFFTGKKFPRIAKLRKKFGTQYAFESSLWVGEGFDPNDKWAREKALATLKEKAEEFDARFDDATQYQLEELEKGENKED